MILLILFFQGPRGIDPLTASILILPAAIGIAVMGPVGGRLSDRYGSREISTLGLFISLVGLIGLATIQLRYPVPCHCGLDVCEQRRIRSLPATKHECCQSHRSEWNGVVSHRQSGRS